MSFRASGFFDKWFPPPAGDPIQAYGVFTTPEMRVQVGCASIVQLADGVWSGVLVLKAGGRVTVQKSKPFLSKDSDLEVAKRDVETKLHEFYRAST